jgi:hypothetical protein
MPHRFRAFLTAALAAAAIGSAAPSAAKTLCGSLEPATNFDFRYYVLEKVKTKIGSHGIVSGYLVSEDGTTSAPFAASYAVYSDVYANVSASWGTTQVFYGYPVWHLNFGAPLIEEAPTTGQAYMSVVDGLAGTVSDGSQFETTWADCKVVPKFPTPAP